MRTRYKIIELRAGIDRWPRYGMWEHPSYRKDLEHSMRTYCQTSEGPYYNNAARWKSDKAILEQGDIVEDNYVCVVLDEEPEKNEFGLVSP